MDSPEVRQLSLTLFAEIKPICVEVSQIALLPPEVFRPESPRLIQSLKKLSDELEKHCKQNCDKEYILSTKFADYVFFPLSNLLKQKSLGTNATRYVLHVVGFLIQHSWAHDMNPTLLDQLCPLVIFLCGGASISNTRESSIVSKDIAFKTSATYCLTAIIKCFPRLHFSDPESGPKRLSILGDSTTILLDIIGSFPSPLNQEDNDVVLSVLSTLKWLYSTRITAEQTSFVFPGVISKIVNFSISTKNLHFTTLIEILNVLRTFIVKVFNDQSLAIDLVDKSEVPDDLQSLRDLLDHLASETAKTELVPFEMKETATAHRTKLWLLATSKQLKLSLIAFFKDILFTSTTRMRIATKTQLQDALFDFFDEIVKECFCSLFNEIVVSSIDMVSTLIYILTLDTNEMDVWDRARNIYVTHVTKNENVFRDQVEKKTTALQTKFSSVLSSGNEEKILIFITAIKFHYHTLHFYPNYDGISLKQELVWDLFLALSNVSQEKVSKASKNELLALLTGGQTIQQEDNKMDDIELPPHIDAKKLAKFNKERSTLALGATELRRFTRDWNKHNQDLNEDINFFGAAHSKTIEKGFLALLTFLGNDLKDVELLNALMLRDIQQEDPASRISAQSVSLWLSSNLLRSIEQKSSGEFDVNKLLDFGDEESDENTESIRSYVLDSALDLIILARTTLAEVEVSSKTYKICESAYAIALQSIQTLAEVLPKEEFQTDFLMEYSYPLLEALTYPGGSVVQLLARKTLNTIVQNYYEGSLEKMVLDNSDYLIDSLSLNLSVASGLTPSLPGILLVILKISGVQLLQTNQLQDILSEIFIVIDSYHGYSALMENFFVVFEEMISQISDLYADSILSSKIELGANLSKYKPWGLSTRDQLLQLVDDTYRQVDPFAEYDSSKEYFKRKPGVPFAEQGGDSDDEDEEETPEKPEEWPSPIPKSIYNSIQQIFTYGLHLLSHPSTKLKIQVLHTLRKSYLLLSSNYKVAMPLLAQHWPTLLAIIAGSTTMSEHEEVETTFQQEQLIIPALELAIEIFKEDVKHESFMSRRFIELWEFLKQRSPIFKSSSGSRATTEVSRTTIPPKMSDLYAQLLALGLSNYQRIIPDLVALDMVKSCAVLGVDTKHNLGRDAQNMLWVVRNHH